LKILEIRRNQRKSARLLGALSMVGAEALSDPSYFFIFYISSDLYNISHCTVKFFQNLQLEKAGFLLFLLAREL